MGKVALFLLLFHSCGKPCPVDTGYDPAPDPDADADGHPASQDCDDAVAAVHPGAVETCDGVDNDCDAIVDEEDAADPLEWFQDRDEDGFGDPGRSVSACAPPPGYLADDTDCDDLCPATFPGAPETCDNADNDCDGTVDEDPTDAPTWYADADGDRFGDAAVTTAACEAPAGHVADGTDCDDTSVDVSPARPETCGNGVDDDCDGPEEDTGCLD